MNPCPSCRKRSGGQHWRLQTARPDAKTEIMFACDTNMERKAITQALIKAGRIFVCNGEGKFYNAWMLPP